MITTTRPRQKERAILFSAAMVRAILEDRKTQTRRVIKPQPDENGFWRHGTTAQCDDCGDHFRRAPRKCQCGCTLFKTVEYPIQKCLRDCPYGSVGDRLWVRETWAVWAKSDVEKRDRSLVVYATESDRTPLTGQLWRPSIHMPRWASRITLEITKVRVERLQDISYEDAKAEGVVLPPTELYPDVNTGDKLKQQFRKLWESINGEGAWDKNPWVFVIAFTRVAPSVGDGQESDNASFKQNPSAPSSLGVPTVTEEEERIEI